MMDFLFAHAALVFAYLAAGLGIWVYLVLVERKLQVAMVVFMPAVMVLGQPILIFCSLGWVWENFSMDGVLLDWSKKPEALTAISLMQSITQQGNRISEQNGRIAEQHQHWQDVRTELARLSERTSALETAEQNRKAVLSQLLFSSKRKRKS